jgi:hypothetical protein
MTDDEAAKRREVQLILLRQGYTQAEAREGATVLEANRLDEYLDLSRESAARFPERAILPEGTPDLHDVKRAREEAAGDVEEEKYFARRDQLAALMAELFSTDELPTAALVALIDTLEDSGVPRLTTIANIEKHLPILRDAAERAEGKR